MSPEQPSAAPQPSTGAPPPSPRTGPPGGMIVQTPTNSLAVVSLVAGVAGYVIPHPFIAGVIAIITGHMARRQIRQTGDGGGSLALIGLILGYVHLALSILLVGVLLLFVLGIGLFAVSQSR